MKRSQDARFATDEQLDKAGLLNCSNGVYLGHTLKSDRFIIWPHTNHLSFIGAAGANKTLWAMINALCNVSQANQIILDPRGSITNVSTLAASINRYEQYVIAPFGCLNAPSHSTDALVDLKPDNPNLIGDTEDIVNAVQPIPHNAHSSNQWPKEDANRWLYALTLYLVYRDGKVTFKSLYHLIMQIEGDTAGAWADNLEWMQKCNNPEIKSFSGEIMAKQLEGKDSFTAPLSELKKTFGFMREPRVAESFSGHDVLPSDLVNPNRKIRVMLVFPAEALKKWATPIRAFLTAVILKKRRSFQSKPIEYFLDECGQLGNSYEGVRKIYSYGRGEKSYARATFQNLKQMAEGWGEAGKEEIMASSQVTIMKGIRDPQTAAIASEMASKFDGELGRGRELSRKQAAVREIISGGDPIAIAQGLKTYEIQDQYELRRAKSIISQGDIMQMNADKMLIFARDMNLPPIMARSKRYFEMPELAGFYLDDPVHGIDRVQIVKKTGRFSNKTETHTARILTGPVPDRFAHLPQYQNAPFRYVEGYRPR